jgi:predicted nuclease with TOPRIM domain
MKNRYKIGFLLLITGFMFLSCSEKHDPFVDLYADIVIAQESGKTSYEEMREVRLELFKKYNMSEEEYKKRLDYYNQDPRRWKEFFDKVIAKVEKMKMVSTQE